MKASTKHSQIFVIQPFGKTSAGVFDLISSAAAQANAFAFRSDSLEAGESLVEAIHKLYRLLRC
jgi:hypothetical protein